MGLLLAGAATLILVSSMALPWWSYSGTDGRGDSQTLTFYPGITYSRDCDGANCSFRSGTYTESSAALSNTGKVFGALQSDLFLALLAGTGASIVALIVWVDRARVGAVRTAMAAAGLGALGSLVGPVWLVLSLVGALSLDGMLAAPATFYGTTTEANWGPGGGWILAIVAAVLFLASAVSQGTTLRFAKPWDAPLDERPPQPTDEPLPVTTPPDRIARLVALRRGGAITDDDLEAQKARILAPESLLRPIPIPPNRGSKEAARAHLDYLRSSGRYTADQQKEMRGRVTAAYGLSPSLEFPEEELHALAARRKAALIGEAEFARRKKEILETI